MEPGPWDAVPSFGNSLAMQVRWVPKARALCGGCIVTALYAKVAPGGMGRGALMRQQAGHAGGVVVVVVVVVRARVLACVGVSRVQAHGACCAAPVPQPRTPHPHLP